MTCPTSPPAAAGADRRDPHHLGRRRRADRRPRPDAHDASPATWSSATQGITIVERSFRDHRAGARRPDDAGDHRAHRSAADPARRHAGNAACPSISTRLSQAPLAWLPPASDADRRPPRAGDPAARSKARWRSRSAGTGPRRLLDAGSSTPPSPSTPPAIARSGATPICHCNTNTTATPATRSASATTIFGVLPDDGTLFHRHLPGRRRRGRQRRGRRDQPGRAGRRGRRRSSRSPTRCRPPAGPTARRWTPCGSTRPRRSGPSSTAPSCRPTTRPPPRPCPGSSGPARSSAGPEAGSPSSPPPTRAGSETDRHRPAHRADRPAQPLPHGRLRSPMCPTPSTSRSTSRSRSAPRPTRFRRRSSRRAILQALNPRGTPRQAGFFNPDNFTFGQPLERSKLEAAIQRVAGVAGVTCIRYRLRNRLGGLTEMGDAVAVGVNQIIRCDNDPSVPEHGSIHVTCRGDDERRTPIRRSARAARSPIPGWCSTRRGCHDLLPPGRLHQLPLRAAAGAARRDRS